MCMRKITTTTTTTTKGKRTHMSRNTIVSNATLKRQQNGAGHGRKRQRMQVQFSRDSLHCFIPSTNFPSDNLRDRWYQRGELEAFRQLAKEYALGINQSEQEPRGFERLVGNPKKQSLQKTLAIRCVLVATQNGMKEDEIAAISRHCSSKFIEDAFWRGCEDYCHAYQPHMLGLLQSKSAMSAKQSDCDQHGLSNQGGIPSMERVRL